MQKKLNAREVETQKAPGTYADGNGLYLQVSAGGAKSWILRYQRDGRRREFGLGSFGAVGLAQAREKAIDARRLLANGTDPIDARRAERINAVVAEVKTITFRECAERYIQAHKAGWRSPKSLKAWEGTLAAFVYPVFGGVPVDQVDVGMVLRAIEPIWQSTTETASRVRGRIEAILDWARARGYRTGENAARWRGHMDQLLPAPTKVRRVQHLAALPYAELPVFMAELRQQDGMAARALEFAILTCCRTGEVLGMRWSEVDLADRLWIIPAERMKAHREHRVPLSREAIAVLTKVGTVRLGQHVFPGQVPGRPLSNMALLMTLRRMKRADLTAHGFRSTFRDWAAERTAVAGEVAELALAHAVGSRVEAAYRRGDQFEKRRLLAEQWARFATSPASGKVLPLRRRPA